MRPAAWPSASMIRLTAGATASPPPASIGSCPPSVSRMRTAPPRCEVLEPVLERGAVAVADRDRQLLVLRDGTQDDLRAAAQLPVQALGGDLCLGEPGVGLLLLRVAHDQDADERDRKHREDHQQDEEEGEAIAEAHVRPFTGPAYACARVRGSPGYNRLAVAGRSPASAPHTAGL